MKIKEGFVVCEISGRIVVIATGEVSKEFNGVVALNETGKFMWEHLQKGCTREELIKSLLANYEATEEVVAKDVDKFLKIVQDAGFIEQSN